MKCLSFTIDRQAATRALLRQVGDAVTFAADVETLDLYTAATELAAIYRLDHWVILDELRRAFDAADEVPISTLEDLSAQIESQVSEYETKEELVERALALIKPDGFVCSVAADGNTTYTAEIRYPVEREKLLADFVNWRNRYQGKSSAFGFHYTPYRFDSNPELSFFETLFEHVGLHPEAIEDIYFTGGITDPLKSDFFVEYRGDDNRWHRYTPDFIVRRKDGRCLIVEIKAEKNRKHEIEGENGLKAVAIRHWEQLNPESLRYEMVFVKNEVVTREDSADARHFIELTNGEQN
jgi:hypothetical protein